MSLTSTMRRPTLAQPVVALHSESGMKMEFHSHSYFEIYYFHSGKVNYIIGDQILVLVPGDLILMNGMTLHCPNVDLSMPYKRTTVHFDPTFMTKFTMNTFSKDLLQPFYEMKNYHIRLDGANRVRAEAMLDRICQLSCKRWEDYQDHLIVATLDLLLMINDQYQAYRRPPMPLSDKERHAQTIIDYIEKHYQENLHMEQLESQLNLNRHYMSKLFKQVTGMTIFEYLYHRRINQAKIHFLFDKDWSVTDVCYKVGFKHPSHFTRMFKAHVGCTPEYFRRCNGSEANRPRTVN